MKNELKALYKTIRETPKMFLSLYKGYRYEERINQLAKQVSKMKFIKQLPLINWTSEDVYSKEGIKYWREKREIRKLRHEMFDKICNNYPQYKTMIRVYEIFGTDEMYEREINTVAILIKEFKDNLEKNES